MHLYGISINLKGFTAPDRIVSTRLVVVCPIVCYVRLNGKGVGKWIFAIDGGVGGQCLSVHAEYCIRSRWLPIKWRFSTALETQEHSLSNSVWQTHTMFSSWC